MAGIGSTAQKAIHSDICSVCGGPLVGLVQEDAWGNQYCVKHASEYPCCTCCQRLICERLTGGGVAYKDSRLVCNVCRKTAIDTKEQAKPFIEAVAAWLYKSNFTFQYLALRVELVYQQDLLQHSEHKGSGKPQGMIFTSIVTGGGRASHRRVDGIAILKGLSRHVMEGIAVHELGHAWLFLHGVDGLGAPVEEGFCNTLSYLYHSNFGTAEAKFCLRVIECDPDPIYGNGFRAVYDCVKRYGLAQIVDYLRLYRILPPI